MCCLCSNESEKQNLRVAVAEALISLEHALPELKEDIIRTHAPILLQTAETILLRPDDEIPEEFRGTKSYEFGMQVRWIERLPATLRTHVHAVYMVYIASGMIAAWRASACQSTSHVFFTTRRAKMPTKTSRRSCFRTS
jgi:hypothetical protein